MKIRMKPCIRLVAVALAASLLYAPAASAADTVVRIGYLKVGHLTPTLLVPELMKACNAQAQLTEFVRYADARTAMQAGSLDVSAVSPGDLLISLAQGSDRIVGLTGVASSPKYLVVRKGVEVNDWGDIKGKKIGIAPGSAVWFQWAATLSEKGIPYTSFTAVNIQGGGTAFVQALKRGDVDAVALWEPFESQVVGEGAAYFAKPIRYDTSRSVGDELGVLAASREALTQRRSGVECFLSAYEKAQDKMAKDPELFATSYAKYTGLPLSVAGPSSKIIKLGGTIDLPLLQRLAKQFYELKVIPKDVSASVDTIWDPSVYKKVTQAQ